MAKHVLKEKAKAKAKGKAKAKATAKGKASVPKDQPGRANPSASAAGKQADPKVYATVQAREIIKCDQLCSEITALVEACVEEEGLAGINALAKATSLRTKLENKLTDGTLKRKLMADNVREVSTEEGGMRREDLGLRGKKVYGTMQALSTKLLYLEPLLKSMACQDHMEIEWSPAFLDRCIADARAAGLAVPFKCRVEVISRHMRGAINEGNFVCAVSMLDSRQENIPFSIKQLSDTPENIEDVQTQVAMELLRLLMDNSVYQLSDVIKVVALLQPLSKGSTLRNLLEKISTALTSEEADVEKAIMDLQQADDDLPRGTHDLFSQGGGKEYLAAARRACQQRAIDGGSSLHHFKCLTWE